MRLFVAVMLPGTVREALGRLTGELAVTGTQVRWVKPRNIHLTLKFLGDVEEEKSRVVVETVKRACRGNMPFEFTVEGVGAFPSARKPRVIWVGVNRSVPLAALHERLEQEFKTTGFPPEQRSW